MNKTTLRLFVAFYIFFNFFKALLADDVFNPAGILCRGFRIDVQGLAKKLCQDSVALIDGAGFRKTALRQDNVPILFHDNQPRLAKNTHGTADARFGKGELIGNIHRAHITISIF